MGEAESKAPIPSGDSSWSGRITRAAAVLGALIAVGQSGAEFVRGWMQERLEATKANAEMFNKYFDLVLSDKNPGDRVLVYGALASIPDHPLKDWAQQHYQQQMNAVTAYDLAIKAQVDAQSDEDEKQRAVEDIQAQINQAQAEIQAAPEDLEKHKELEARYKDLEGKLALAKGALAEIKETKVAVASTVQKINAGDLTINAVKSVTRTDFVLIDRLSTDMLRPAFPQTPIDNIEKNLPYVKAALKEFHIVTPQLIAFTFATMRSDNESFDPVSEAQSRFNTTPGGTPFDKYEPESPTGRALGNEQKGDGALFKGRGFVLITGRTNYKNMSARLGVDLIGSPDRANDPEVAARVLCAFIADRQDKIRPALDANNLVAALRTVTGGASGLDRITQTYQTILAALRSDPSNYQVLVQFYGDLSRDAVRQMMTDLRDAGGWNVQGVAGGGERTQAAKGYSEVRFAAGSEKAAQSLAASVQDSKLIDKSIVPKLNDNVAPGTLEIWLSK
jgi:hypothetical protein